MGKEYFKQCHQLLAIYTALKFIAAITLVYSETKILDYFKRNYIWRWNTTKELPWNL